MSSVGEKFADAPLVPPPPGEIIDTQPNSGWIEGSFSVSHDGVAEYHLPLWIPDGRRGLEPELALHYSSSSGNGLAGVGWSLQGLSSIAPCPRTMAQDGRNENVGFWGPDAYCLDGQRLRSTGTAPAPDQVEYRMERDASARIISYGSSNSILQPYYFKVWTKNGKVLTFGGVDAARLRAFRLTGTEPENPSLVPDIQVTAVWALNRIEDRNGNAIDIQYDRLEDAGNRWSVEFVPKQLTYGPDRKVELVYETRPDPIDGFRAGRFGSVHIQLRKRLKTIKMSAGTDLLREYRLTYPALSDPPVTITGRSLLSAIEECDPRGVCLNSLVFDWSSGSHNFDVIDTDVTDIGGFPPGEREPGYNRFTPGDVNGDGADDLFYLGPSPWKVRLSNTVDGFNAPEDTGIPWNFLERPTTQGMDVDRDGQMEIAYLNTAHGAQLYRWNGSFYSGTGLTDDVNAIRGTYFVDLNADGLADYLAPRWQPGDSLRWRFALNRGHSPSNDEFDPVVETDLLTHDWGSPFYHKKAVPLDGRAGNLVVWGGSTDASYAAIGLTTAGLSLVTDKLNLPFNKGPENRQGDRRNLQFADVNGDGLEDAIYPATGLSVQLNSGAGFSDIIPGPTEEYVSPELPGAGYDLKFRIVDFNGDGADDVLILHRGTPSGPDDYQRGMQLYTWRNGSFVRVKLGNNAVVPPGQTLAQLIQPLDFNGDGAMDIAAVWTENKLRLLRRQGGIPDKMIRVTVSGLGPRVEVEYTTLADRRVHTPCSGVYPTICPVRGGSIVSRHRMANALESDSAWHEFRHEYRHARHDALGGAWLGFAEHEVRDEALANATTVTYLDNTTRREVPTSDGLAQVYPFARQPSAIRYFLSYYPYGSLHQYERTINRELRFRAGTVPGTYLVQLDDETDSDREDSTYSGSWTELHSRVSSYQYDEFGNVTKATTSVPGFHRVDEMTYDNDGVNWLIGQLRRQNATSCTVPDNLCVTRSSSRDYYPNGNLKEVVVEPDDQELLLRTDIDYGSYGNIASIVTSDGHREERRARVTYDNRDLYPVSVTNALGHVVQTAVDPGLGVPLSSTDPNGVVFATMKYDRLGRLREVNHAGGYFERFVTSGPLVHSTLVPDGADGTLTAERIALDKLGRQRERSIAAFGGGFSSTVTTYDGLGRVAARSLPFAAGSSETIYYTTYDYDDRDRLLSVEEPDGAIIRHEYINLETHTYDANGNHSYTLERGDGRIDSQYEDDPKSTAWLPTRFQYGPFGLVNRVMAADGTSQTMAYDKRGRRKRLDDPSTGTTITDYTAFGEVSREIDGAGSTTEYLYDVLGRLRRITSPDGEATFRWDTATDGIGRPTNFRSADGVSVAYGYDSLGRPSTTRWTIDGTQYEITNAYDDIGRLARITYPAIPQVADDPLSDDDDPLTVQYVYNEHGYLLAVRDAAANGPVYWTAEARNSARQLTQERYGNGVVMDYTYQPTTELLSEIAATGDGDIGSLGLLRYVYDPNRNVTGRDDLFNNRSETYDHDELNRLITWTANAGPTRLTATYDYDEVGNLKSETVEGVPHQSATYRYGESGAPPHALTSRNSFRYGYDGAGRQTSGPQRTVEYNRLGLPKVLNWGQGQRTEFAYDPLGARALKRDDGQTVVYVGGLFERRSPAGTGSSEIHNLHNIIVQGRTVAQVNRAQGATDGRVTGTSTYYLHTDIQGSITLITNAAGRAISASDYLLGDEFLGELLYDPFGCRINAQYVPLGANRHGGPRQGYTGHEHEDEYGLINMKGRIYDPGARRFLTPDPIVQDLLSSQSHNRYSYVRNNPATLIDPTGYQGEHAGDSVCYGVCVEIDGGPGGTGDGPPNDGVEPRDYGPWPGQDYHLGSPPPITTGPGSADDTSQTNRGAAGSESGPTDNWLSDWTYGLELSTSGGFEPATGWPEFNARWRADGIICAFAPGSSACGATKDLFDPINDFLNKPGVREGIILAVPGGGFAKRPAAARGATSKAIPRLADNIAKTFAGGKYHVRVLQQDVVAYRYSGGVSGVQGRFLTTQQTVRQIGSPAAAQRALSLPPGATAEQLNALLIPKGTTIYYGRVAGGGEAATQVFVEDASVLRAVP